MRRMRLHTKILSVIALLGMLWGAQATYGQERSSRLIWSQVSGIAADIHLADVFMVDQNNAWAVGRQERDGTITGVAYRLQLRDGRWQATLGPAFGTALNAVVALSANEVWVVGEGGLIAHNGQRTWLPQWVGEGISLRTIQVFGNGQGGWIGGAQVDADGISHPIMLRYQDFQWERDPNVTGEGAIESLHFAPDGGWAAGGDRLWRHQNGRWQSQEAPLACDEPGCYPGFGTVRAISGDEVWIAGSRWAACGVCVPRPYVIHRDGGRWVRELPDKGIAGWEMYPTLPGAAGFSSAYFTSPTSGILVGTWIDRTTNIGPRPLVAKYSAGNWSAMDVPPMRGGLQAISMADETHALAVGDNGIILAYGYGPQGGDGTPTNPTARVPNPNQAGVLYFNETGHTLRGAFQSYWQTYGGLAQFGYPVTEEYRERNPDDGREYTVQYFERARFEYHPEFVGTRYEVLLGLLGHTVTEGRKGEAPFLRTQSNNMPGGRYYPETGHNLAPQFIARWDGTGGLPVYGYPISEAFYEVSPTDGKTYLVQYFERNRFEYHPEFSGSYHEVLLGLLGSEVLRARGWL
jgi:hypothetical protein